MITILTDLIHQALAKGYERQHLMIQITENLAIRMLDSGAITRTPNTHQVFMGIKVETIPSERLYGEGFMLWHDGPIPHDSGLFIQMSRMLGSYSTSLGL